MKSNSINSSLNKLLGKGLGTLSISLQVYCSLKGVARDKTAFTVQPEEVVKKVFCSSGVGTSVGNLDPRVRSSGHRSNLFLHHQFMLLFSRGKIHLTNR